MRRLTDGRRTLILAAFVASCTPSTSISATLFGLCDTGEMFSSTNVGVTWTAVEALPVSDAVALSALLSPADLCLVSGSGGVFRSSNAGADWQAVGSLTASDLVDLAVAANGHLYVLTSAGAVYRSTDGGVTFAVRGSVTAPDCVSIAIDTQGALHLLSRTGSVYRSSDGGVNWSSTAALSVSNAVRLRRRNSDLALLTETGDVAIQPNGSSNWTFVGTLSQVGSRGLIASGGSLYAATQEGHVAASPNGADWTWRGSMNQLRLIALASDDPTVTDVPGDGTSAVIVGHAWPNPAAGGAVSFSLRMVRAGSLDIALIDPVGRLVSSERIEASGGDMAISWPVDDLPSGTYWIHVSSAGEGVASHRVVVVR